MKMKKLIFALLALASFITTKSQSIAISQLPTYSGNPAGGFVPVSILGTTRKVDPALFAYKAFDSLVITYGSTIDTFRFYNRSTGVIYTALYTKPAGGSGSTPFADNTALLKNNSDNTKLVILNAGNITTGTTRTWNFPDVNGTFANIAAGNTFTGANTFSAAPIITPLAGYLYGNASSAITASTTIPTTALSGTITNSQLAGSIAFSKLVGTDITTVGTIGAGLWNGTLIGPTYGGTGINNGSNTITLAGNLATFGANALTLTTTGSTNVTFPTSGTLITNAVSTLSSLNSIGTVIVGTWNATVVAPAYGGTGVNNSTNTITLAGNLATTGTNSLTLATTGTTSVTLPTTGTLVNSAVSTLSSLASIGTITTGIWNGTIIDGAHGGTNNGFMTFTGPTTSLKTFTLPNATATILTDNAVVTATQGGTGVASLTAGYAKSNGASAFTSVTAIPSSDVTFANNFVTNSLLVQMVAHTYKGNNTGSTANPIDVTSTQLTADLNLFTTSLQGLVPSSGGGSTNFLRADGTWAAPSGGGSTPPFADNAAIVKNNSDNTKLLILSAASITTGTTRTATFPDANITVARSDAAQTLTGVQTLSSAPIFTGLTGHLSGNGASAITASATIPTTDLSGTITNAQLTGSITASKLVGTDIATVGTVTAGTWNSTVIGATYGGTGVNNGSNTITLAGTLTTSGAFNTTLTATGTTSITLPTSGTLAINSGAQTFTGTQTFSSAPTLSALTVNGGLLFNNSSGVIQQSSNILFDATNNGIKLISPSIGVSPANAKGLYLQNATVASSGNQQYSPGIVWEGQGWKTNSTAASQAVNFREYLGSIQGAAAPSFSFQWDGSVNGGAYSNLMNLNSGGQLTVASSISAGGGISATGTLTATTAIGAGATSFYTWGGGTTQPNLYSDANYNMTIRNGTNANEVWVDNTFTDATHYEAGVFGFIQNSNILSIGTKTVGNTLRNTQFIGGTFGMGVAPVSGAELKVIAGTTTLAPILQTSGTLNTTIQSGAVEYNNAHYVSNSGLNRVGIGGPIVDFTTDAGNTSTTETDLYTYTTKVSTLAVTGEKLTANFSGNVVGSATASRAINVYFAGTNIFAASSLTVSANANFDVAVKIIRTGSTTARATCTVTIDGVSLATPIVETDLTGLTFTNTNILKITGTSSGTGSATNDIVAKMGTIYWWPAANN